MSVEKSRNLIVFCNVKLFGALVDGGRNQLTAFEAAVKVRGDIEGCVKLKTSGKPTIVPLDNYPTLFDDLHRSFIDVNLSTYTPPTRTHTTSAEHIEVFKGEQSWFVNVKLPPGADTYTIGPFAWKAPARPDKRLWFPTQEGATQNFQHNLWTVNTTSMGGEACQNREHNRCFRWDLFSGIQFPVIAVVRRLAHTGSNQRGHDILFATHDTNLKNRRYVAGDGTIFVDNTNLSIVRFEPYGLATMPLVNGAYLTIAGGNECYHFNGTLCVFNEMKGYIKMTDDVGMPQESVYYIYPAHVRYHRGVPLIEYYPQPQPQLVIE